MIYLSTGFISCQAPGRHGLLAIGGVTIILCLAIATAWGLPHDLPADDQGRWPAIPCPGKSDLRQRPELDSLPPNSIYGSVSPFYYPALQFTHTYMYFEDDVSQQASNWVLWFRLYSCNNWHYPSLPSCPPTSWSRPHYLWGSNLIW